MTEFVVDTSRVLLATLSTVAAFVMYWQVCAHGTLLRKIGRAVAAGGWLGFSWIWWWRIFNDQPIIIHPVAHVMLVMVAAGTILIYMVRHK